MSNANSCYTATLKNIRKENRTRLNNFERGYNLLQNKDSSYAKEYAAIIELQKATMKIWDDAPEAI
jgi:vacuolar-type H+-ATPase subunit D/Vma8